MSLPTKIIKWQHRVEDALNRHLPTESMAPQRLHQAMRYSVFNGGKRIRPVLVYAAGTTLGVPEDHLDVPASAVELIHAYSLIHDDLPAMDNDDLRRGKPTCHKAFDEATAILAGDAMQSLAFHLLAQHIDTSVPVEQKLGMLDHLAIASGSRGMAGGQAMDLDAMGKHISEAELENMHIHKTGALIRASVALGAQCSAEADKEDRAALDHYAKCIGLAFQIQDDVLDETGDTRVLGKAQGADRALNKPNYPAILGLEASQQLAQELCDDALSTLERFDEKADNLRWLARYIVERKH